jgi:hypothetical protein
MHTVPARRGNVSLQTCQCKLQLCRVYVLIHLTCVAGLPDQVHLTCLAGLPSQVHLTCIAGLPNQVYLTCLAGLPDQVYAQRQAALHQGQAEQIRHTALNCITPSPSPFLLVPQTLAPQQVRSLMNLLLLCRFFIPPPPQRGGPCCA